MNYFYHYNLMYVTDIYHNDYSSQKVELLDDISRNIHTKCIKDSHDNS